MRARIELAHSAFAEPCLTTWLPHPKVLRTAAGVEDINRYCHREDLERKEAQFAVGTTISHAARAFRGAEREEAFAREIERPAARASALLMTSLWTPARCFARVVTTCWLFHKLEGEGSISVGPAISMADKAERRK